MIHYYSGSRYTIIARRAISREQESEAGYRVDVTGDTGIESLRLFDYGNTLVSLIEYST